MQHGEHKINLASTKLTNTINSAIVIKILKMSVESQKYLNLGKIMSIVNVDIG